LSENVYQLKSKCIYKRDLQKSHVSKIKNLNVLFVPVISVKS